MTIIPDDDSNSGERRDVTDRIAHAGERTEDSARRIAAAITGALEGFIEALERYDVANEAKDAMHEAGELARQGGGEAYAQGQTPEMQQLGRGLKTAGSATAGAVGTAAHSVGDAARSVGDAARSTADSVHTGATHLKENVAGAYDHAKTSAREQAESVKYAAVRAKEEVKVRAHAVAETGRRARVAPGRIRHEIGAAITAWKRGLVTAIAMFAALTIFATIALIVLTIALVVGLNELIGDPAGTFVVALLYLVIAGIAFAVAKSARAKAAHEQQERMMNAREEVRHVTRPVKDAFTRGRSGI